MTTALILVSSAILISLFVTFNLKKQNSIVNQGDKPTSKQFESKFPIVMVMLLIVFAAGLATYTLMRTILANS